MSLFIGAIPREDDYVWKISSEKIPHMTLLFLGEDASESDIEKVTQFVQHAAETTLAPIWMHVDRRGILGKDEADVLFFNKDHLSKPLDTFRKNLLMHPTIKRLYESVEQFPEWTPHLTLGYPETPAKTDLRDFPSFYSVTFDRIAVWTGDYEGPEFILKDDRSMEAVDVMMSDFRAKFLSHYGVKGQRWGVRRSKAALARSSKRELSADAKRAKELSKKKRSELTNEELQFLNTRKNLEQNFDRLNPTTIARGENRTRNILGTIGIGVTAYNTINSPAGKAAIRAGSAAASRALGNLIPAEGLIPRP